MEDKIKRLLKNDHLTSVQLNAILQYIDQIPAHELSSFYASCISESALHLAVFSKIKESDFDSWDYDFQWDIIEYIAFLFREWGEDFSLIPDYLRKEHSILLSFVQDYFDRTDEEIALFKQIIKETGLGKDEEFISKVLKVDDGSVASIIVDKSLDESREYQMKRIKAYYNSPKEYFLPDQAICGIPDKLMNDFSFIRELIAINYNFLPYLKDQWRENQELCEIALRQNGMLLKDLPKSIQNNFNLAAIALQQNPKATLYVSEDLIHNVDFLRQVVGENEIVLDYALPRMKHIPEW